MFSFFFLNRTSAVLVLALLFLNEDVALAKRTSGAARLGFRRVNEQGPNSAITSSTCDARCALHGVCREGVCYCKYPYRGKWCDSLTNHATNTDPHWSAVYAALFVLGMGVMGLLVGCAFDYVIRRKGGRTTLKCRHHEQRLLGGESRDVGNDSAWNGVTTAEGAEHVVERSTTNDAPTANNWQGTIDVRDIDATED